MQRASGALSSNLKLVLASFVRESRACSTGYDTDIWKKKTYVKQIDFISLNATGQLQNASTEAWIDSVS